MLFVSCLCVALLECSACNMSFHVECSPTHSKSHYICPFKSTNQVDGVRFCRCVVVHVGSLYVICQLSMCSPIGM